MNISDALQSEFLRQCLPLFLLFYVLFAVNARGIYYAIRRAYLRHKKLYRF